MTFRWIRVGALITYLLNVSLKKKQKISFLQFVVLYKKIAMY